VYRIGDKDYKLIYMDTNALRETILNVKQAGKGFLNTFFLNNNNYAPCFSFMNVVELKPYHDIYRKFLEYFDVMSCIMFYLPQAILKNEYQVYLGQKMNVLDFDIMRTSSPFFKDKTLMLRGFLNEKWNELELSVRSMIDDLDNTTKVWEMQRLRSKFESIVNPSYKVDMNYYLSKEKDAVIRDLKNFGVSGVSNDMDISKFPGARQIEFSQFMKVYNSKKAIKKNDALDVSLSCVVPYVDAVITEASMAEIYKQSKSFIPQMNSVEIYTLKDIRIAQ